MDNDIYKDYSDEKLNKTFAYYKKEIKYSERTGKQSIIDTYNAIKDEIVRRKTLAGQDKVENNNNSFEKEENRKKNDSHIQNKNNKEQVPFVDNTFVGQAKKIKDIQDMASNLNVSSNYNVDNSKPSDNIKKGYEMVISDEDLRRDRRKLISMITRAEKAGKVDPKLYNDLNKLNKEIERRHSDRINANDEKTYANERLAIENNGEKVPLIEDKQGKIPLIEDKQGKIPLIEDKQGKIPLIEDKQGKIPLIEDKRNKIPLLEYNKDRKPIRTGLQVLREEYNKMPEITRKHTASERTKPITLALTLGTAAAAVLSGGVLPIVLGLSAGSALIGLGLKPFLKKVTRQSKIENQIADQFRNLNEQDYKMLTDYLTEEKIVDLKLNAVVLHALNKVNIEKTTEEKNKLDETKARLTRENIDLMEEFDDPNTTKERKSEIENIMKKNSLEIDSIQGYTVQGTGEKVLGKAEIAERKLKDLKRGMERQTWNYRGNVEDKGLLGRFSNIFSHRNTSTKEYLPVLNEYADAEYEMLDKKENDNDIIASEKARKTMEEIERDNSDKGFLGRHVGVFNSRNGAMRIMSDVLDDTFKIAATVGLATIGFAKTLSTMTENIKVNDQNIQMGQNVKGQYDNVRSQMEAQYSNISKNDIHNANDAIATDYANMREGIGFRMEGMFSNPAYRKNDIDLNEKISNFAGDYKINDGSMSSMIEKLSENKKFGIMDQVDLNNTSDAMRKFTTIDHHAQADYIMNSNEQIQAESGLLKNLAGFARIFENWKDIPANFKQIKLDLLGPITMLMSPILGIKHDADRNKETAINMKNQEKNDDKEI